jgi:hypothetical protein
MNMLLAALALLAVGVLLTATALAPPSWDFAVSVMPGWHVTVFPVPLWLGVLVTLGGLVALLAFAQGR